MHIQNIKLLSAIGVKLWPMLKLHVFYFQFDLWPWRMTLTFHQNVQLDVIHMYAKYQVATCNSWIYMNFVKVGRKQTNQQTNRQGKNNTIMYVPQYRLAGGHKNEYSGNQRSKKLRPRWDIKYTTSVWDYSLCQSDPFCITRFNFFTAKIKTWTYLANTIYNRKTARGLLRCYLW